MTLRQRAFLIPLILITAGALGAAEEIALTALTVPDGQTVAVGLVRTNRAPSKASMQAAISVEKKRGSVSLNFDKMEPAILFSGDIAAYVLWAVAPDGTAENLGEIVVDKKNCSGSQRYYTSKRSLALMVTAEPRPSAIRPSDLVLFTAREMKVPGVQATPFAFANFQTGAKRVLESIAGFQYGDDTPVTYVQAQRVMAQAEALNAAAANPNAMRDARIAYEAAKKSLQAKGGRDAAVTWSRQALQMASQAAMDAVRAEEARAAAAAEAKRLAEKAALEQRANAAETEAQRVSRELKEVEAQRAAMALEARELTQQRDAFAADRDKAAAERDSLAVEREALKKERDELAGMLKGALSKVAETNETARGVIVSLPGILFDVNKATLKFPSQLTVAKLAGILTVFQNMDLSIEGHTDATGSDEFNMKLSADRARSVYDFLRGQGIPEVRMRYQGLGSADPVAPNDTEINRAKNRRVEVVLTQGAKKP